MNEEQERRDLVDADKHIAAAERLVAEQENRIFGLIRGGYDAQLARELLQTMRQALAHHVEHREMILKTLQSLKAR
jgi:hypothetical protein